MAPFYPPQFNCVSGSGWLKALDCLSVGGWVWVGLSWVFTASPGILSKRLLTEDEWMDFEPSDWVFSLLADLLKKKRLRES